jgi:hypothetical protein
LRAALAAGRLVTGGALAALASRLTSAASDAPRNARDGTGEAEGEEEDSLERAAVRLAVWARGLRGASASEVAAALLAANTPASARCALSMCEPLTAPRVADDAGADAIAAVKPWGATVRPGPSLMRVAAMRCDRWVVEALIDRYGLPPTAEGAAAAAGAGRGDIVLLLLRRAARSGATDAILHSMARAAWVRAAWRDVTGRAIGRMAVAVVEARRRRSRLLGHGDGSAPPSAEDRTDDDDDCDDADGRETASRVDEALARAADAYPPWWRSAARFGNVAAFEACARVGLAHCPTGSLSAAASGGRVAMCAWILERDAALLGVGPRTPATEMPRARRALAAWVAPLAADAGSRCGPVLDWLCEALGFVPSEEDASAVLAAAMRAPLPAALPVPHAALYMVRAWPSAAEAAIRRADAAVWRSAFAALVRAVDSGRWVTADAMVALLDRVARVRDDADAWARLDDSDAGGVGAPVSGPIDLWVRVTADVASRGHRRRMLHTAPLARAAHLDDVRRLYALAVRCVGGAARPSAAAAADRAVAALARRVGTAPAWLADGAWLAPSFAGAVPGAWLRWCRPAPVSPDLFAVAAGGAVPTRTLEVAFMSAVAEAVRARGLLLDPDAHALVL